jgi:hypothetical protein
LCDGDLIEYFTCMCCVDDKFSFLIYQIRGCC